MLLPRLGRCSTVCGFAPNLLPIWKWKMENGKWKMENGKWKMENGKWNEPVLVVPVRFSLLLLSAKPGSGHPRTRNSGWASGHLLCAGAATGFPLSRIGRATGRSACRIGSLDGQDVLIVDRHLLSPS
jgi:hypothetical protein